MAVIGAGIAGLAAARSLSRAGLSVVVFDKGRGPGGRTSTRRAEPVSFDHGAQYFTARDERFRAAVATWTEAGLVAPWKGRIATLGSAGSASTSGSVERLVGVPGMNAVAKHLARGLDVRCGVRVAALAERSAAGWVLRSSEGDALGEFAQVLLTVPGPQAAELLPATTPLAATAAAVEMSACSAALLTFDGAWDLPFDGAFVEGRALAWVARNSSKPGRPPGEAWVLHTNPAWSLEHWDDEPSSQIAALLAELERLAGRPAPPVVASDLHRWRYAVATDPLDAGCLVDSQRGLVLAGDWCQGNRVEGAWLSGVAAADRLRGDAVD
ncbi:protoporphyrinogen oxidase [Planctomycetes bacterium Pla86]|uniref:Protoporphyrinogen oxidase n=2 Tax=Engelhardtia mirabilis TaxID=2528011 RepID=A0A518BQE5_9BACT|nr:protoporphyrinogen oxidase [Planctomycetes bacterium Pla133]QDV03522.1 protoporphyrinogen oxidase [Planctomycetes bacterium Pla86]